MGSLRLVDIGVAAQAGAATMLGKACIAPPQAEAHKYIRGLLGIIGAAAWHAAHHPS